MFIQTQDTPNPSVIKFLPGQEILKSGQRDYPTVETAKISPLAQRLFGLTGVAGVFLGEDFVSVTKDDATDWNMLKPMILGALMEHLATAQPIMDMAAVEALKNASSSTSNNKNDEDDAIAEQIKILLEERVRPAVAQDGGDIVFDHFDHDTGIVYLQMQGACAGCPSSTMTLKAGIENMLRHYVPEVQEVRPVA